MVQMKIISQKLLKTLKNYSKKSTTIFILNNFYHTFTQNIVMNYPTASLIKNDKKANIFIWAVSAVVFVAVVVLHELKIEVDLGFDPHIFAQLNAIINGTVALLLIFGLFPIQSNIFG